MATEDRKRFVTISGPGHIDGRATVTAAAPVGADGPVTVGGRNCLEYIEELTWIETANAGSLAEGCG